MHAETSTDIQTRGSCDQLKLHAVTNQASPGAVEAQPQLTALGAGATQTGTPELLARSLQVMALFPARTEGVQIIERMSVEAQPRQRS